MTHAIEAVLHKAMQLKPVERAELIAELYHSFDPPDNRRVDDLWVEEAEARIDAYDAGKLTADSAEAVFKRINKR